MMDDDTRPELRVHRPDEAELRRAITALSGVFAALSWVDLEVVDSCITEGEQRNTAAALVLAGELLCKGLIDRI